MASRCWTVFSLRVRVRSHQGTSEQKNLLPETTTDIGPLRRDARLLLERARALQTKRRGQEVVLDEELSERLKALGYIN